jgi:PAS domain S-box-containing protein
MVIADERGKIRLVNAQAEIMFGYPRAELLGCDIEVLLPERFRGRHRLHRQQYAVNGRVRPMGADRDLCGRHRTGREFPVEINLSPLQTSAGLLVSAAVRDISDRRDAEQETRELAMIAESSQDAILTTALDGVIAFWNEAAARLYGYTAAEAVGRHVSMLAPPDRTGEIDIPLGRLRRGERVQHFETLRRTKSGTMLDVDLMLWPIRDRGGNVVRACAIARDITVRKRAEQETARRFEQQEHIALTLQNALIGQVTSVAGVRSASRYLPATQGAGVGGDWFDLIPLGAGRTGVMIGDVMGRGLEAAATMGKMRLAAKALALTGMPPQQLMQYLELIARDMADRLTTCCYLVIDPHTGEVTGCSAGHLPVLVVGQDSIVRQLPLTVSPPLGVGDIPHQQVTVPVPAGATLVLYTDGLVERRDRDIDEQLASLEDVLHMLFSDRSGLEQAADEILTAFRPAVHEPPDDVTLLMAEMPSGPLSSYATTLPPVPESIGAGRACVRDILAEWCQHDQADAACLLTTEILANAVRHARSPAWLRVYLTASEIIIEVTDDSAQLPQRGDPGPDDESGRGLVIVDALATSWGARPTGTGKAVWFTLAAVTAARERKAPARHGRRAARVAAAAG